MAVEGRIQTRNYDGQDGKKVYVTEVVCDSVQLLPSGNHNTNTNTNATQQTYTPSNEPSYTSSYDTEDTFSNTPSLDISTDDLPFY